MRATIREYVHTVIDQDFPSQRAGILPRRAPCWSTTSSGSCMPTSRRATSRRRSSSSSSRRSTTSSRCGETASTRPRSNYRRLFWLVLWVGAAINTVLIAFIYVQRLRLHLLIAGLLALFIGLVMFVTADMDHPYQGGISVGPGAFQRVLDQTLERVGGEP